MSGLSTRGERFAKEGDVRAQLTEIWENVYHANDNADGTINLGTAENYVMLEDVASFVNHKVLFRGNDLDYGAGPWGSARLREAMAKHMNKYLKPFQPVRADNLVFATGCTSICDMLGFTLFEPGDGLLLSRPIYQSFQYDFALRAEVTCKFVSFEGENQFTSSIVKRYENAIESSKSRGIMIKAMIICNPHNPLGECYDPDALIAFMKLCQKHRIHLILDEIYALSIYELSGDEEKQKQRQVPFKSILSFDTDKYIESNYIHHMYGFSKDLASGGLRIGCLLTHNEALRSAISALTFFSWPSNVSERIAIAMLEDEQWLDNFILTSRKRLGERSAFARALLNEHGIPYHAAARAGFFLWLDVRKHLTHGDTELTWDQHKWFKKQLREHKVYISGGDSLSAESPGFFRLCFVKPEAEVRTGLARVLLALQAASKSPS